MSPKKVSAQFAAFVWFANRAGQEPADSRQAWAYARAHWQSFLPMAHDGLGRLLLAIADGGSRRKVAKRGELAAAC